VRPRRIHDPLDWTRNVFDRFTARARMAIALTAKESERFNLDHIGTEAMLIALLTQEGAAMEDAFTGLSAQVATLRAAVERAIVPRTGPGHQGPMRFNPQAKRALELAVEESRALGHAEIDSEHLLLGILAQPDTTATQAFHDLRLAPDQVAREIRARMGADG
jgi:ATP-dependent Clp protease ATP-binding subunit ClpC